MAWVDVPIGDLILTGGPDTPLLVGGELVLDSGRANGYFQVPGYLLSATTGGMFEVDMYDSPDWPSGLRECNAYSAQASDTYSWTASFLYDLALFTASPPFNDTVALSTGPGIEEFDDAMTDGEFAVLFHFMRANVTAVRVWEEASAVAAVAHRRIFQRSL